MDIDAALKLVGEYGKLQRRVVWSMCLPQAFVAWQHVQNVFVGAEPNLTCVRESIASEGCPKPGETRCSSYSYSQADFSSTASEWNLVCDEAYKSDLLQSFYMAGLLVGNLAGGFIADQYGRQRIVCVSVLCITLLSIAALFSSTYESYVAWRCLSAVATGAYGLVSFTLPTELVGSEHRGFVNLITTVSYAMGIGSLAVIAYLFRDWRMLSVVVALPGLISIFYFRYFPESPRWLLSQGRVSEAEQVLQYIASVDSTNRGKPGPLPAIKLEPPPQKNPTKKGAQVSKAGGSVLDLLRHAALCRRTSVNVYTWKVATCPKGRRNRSHEEQPHRLLKHDSKLTLLVGSGFHGRAKNCGGVAFGNTHLPVVVLRLKGCQRFGRRWTNSRSLFVGGLSCAVIAFLPSGYAQLTTLLAFCGKMAISVSFCVCWIHAAEMYPTIIRNKALSVCNMASRIGGVMAPLVLTLGRLHANTDWAVFGVLGILAALLSRALPETLNRPLPEVIEDIDLDKTGSLKVGRTKVIEVKAIEGVEKQILLNSEKLKNEENNGIN